MRLEALPVSTREATALFEFLSVRAAPRAVIDRLRPAEAIFAFCRLDPLVAAMAVKLYGRGFAPLVMFTGGVGKDSGPILERYQVPEAVFQAALANHDGIPAEAIIVEPEAVNGGDNCRLGYAAITSHLGRPPASLILMAHAVSALRLYEQFLTIAACEGWPGIDVQVYPTDFPFDATNPAHLLEAAQEMMRLVEWPEKFFDNGDPYLRRAQPDLPGDLVYTARRILAAQ